IALAILSVTGSAVSQATPPDRQAVAQHILKIQASKFLTSPAQSALHMMANKDRQLTPGQQKLGPAKPASGGVGPPAPSFGNVRVNDPALDTNQVDQTTQSETAVAVSGQNVV